jgi:ParB family chromosome partitioning protein
MLAFMTDQSEVHREVVRLRERLTEFDGAQATRQLDPKLITASRWANRDASHFQTLAFMRLKEEIASSGGNVQPIKVRSIVGAPSGAAQYEVVFGHRRHRACLELGLPVLALVDPAMKDIDLFVEMERENREREDLSAWEQGVMYLRALEQGLFPSAKQLAAAIDRDLGNIGKAMALAKLPAEVIRAFGSPMNLQFRWATALKDAHQRDPEGLLAAAREIAARTPATTPAEAFGELTGQGRAARSTAHLPTEWKGDDGRRIAVLSFDRKGRATLVFDHPMDEGQRRKLAKAIDAFVGHKA